MKKRTIFVIAAVMGISLLTLLYLQFRYFENVYDMRKEQLVQAVSRSLSQTAQTLELNETRERLEAKIVSNSNATTDTASTREFLRSAGLSTDVTTAAETAISDALRDTMESYFSRDELMQEMLTILYEPSDKTLADRLDFKELDSNIKQALAKNGIDLHYHFRVTTSDGREVFRCQDYDATGADDAYRQELFPNDPRPQMGVLYVHFPDMQKYIFYSVRFMIPAIAFTLVVLITFCFTIYTIFRQKRLSEIKNDFINNMTHEFKTPISTISLAAQMLNDPSVAKSETMYKHVSGIINDETKRLRFQVEKVLQMSMFDRKAATFKKREVDANKLVSDVVNTFRLKVETSGGSITADLQATDSTIFVDEMHFTNVIFNLLDNAVKYRKADEDLHLKVATRNNSSHVVITVEDNGIGIKREDLKKIFEKFYRVHTGNRHDVKGFGLGLAYVKNVVVNLGGTITADSDFGKGTKFIITLPILKTTHHDD